MTGAAVEKQHLLFEKKEVKCDDSGELFFACDEE